MISINETLILQVIHFLILVFILNRLMFRPILRLINERGTYVDDAKKETVKISEETAELVDRCVSMEKDARNDARNENSKLKREAIAMAEKIFDDTREEISSIRDEATKEVDEQLKRAQQSLQREALVLADEITVKVIGRRIGN